MDGTAIPVASPNKRGISGSTIKLVAIFTMLIDHTAATILDSTLIKNGMYSLDYNNSQAVQDFYTKYDLLIKIDGIMRSIGRLAFPIFCFLLVEGMLHTHNKLKYTMRLALFAIVSEIPFDLAFMHQPFYWEYQNVYFTLLIGLLVLIGFNAVTSKLKDKKWLPALSVIGSVAAGYIAYFAIPYVVQFINGILTMFSLNTINFEIKNYYLIILSVLFLLLYILLIKVKSLADASVLFTDMIVLAAGVFLAEYLKTDYSGFGVLTIAIMYGLRRSHVKSMLGGCISLTIMSIGEYTAFVDLILIRLYNGKRGLNLKYVFYLFYPVHLLLLYLICYLMKIV